LKETLKSVTCDASEEVMSAQRKPAQKPTSAARTRAYRERMRAKGLKPVTIWTYDMNDPELVARWQEQSRALVGTPAEEEAIAWIEASMAEDGLD
jgi:hypothetical protein